MDLACRQHAQQMIIASGPAAGVGGEWVQKEKPLGDSDKLVWHMVFFCSGIAHCRGVESPSAKPGEKSRTSSLLAPINRRVFRSLLRPWQTVHPPPWKVFFSRERSQYFIRSVSRRRSWPANPGERRRRFVAQLRRSASSPGHAKLPDFNGNFAMPMATPFGMPPPRGPSLRHDRVGARARWREEGFGSQGGLGGHFESGSGWVAGLKVRLVMSSFGVQG